MDTKKRTTLLLILAISLFMLWDNWQVYRGGSSLIFRHEAKKTDPNANLPEVPVETAAVPVEKGTGRLSLRRLKPGKLCMKNSLNWLR